MSTFASVKHGKRKPKEKQHQDIFEHGKEPFVDNKHLQRAYLQALKTLRRSDIARKTSVQL